MKSTIKYLILAAVIVASGYFLRQYIKNIDYVSNATFEEAHRVLNQKLDSLKVITLKIEANTDTIKTDMKEVKKSIDSLKEGEKILFEQTQIIIKNQNQGFIPKEFLDFFK